MQINTKNPKQPSVSGKLSRRYCGWSPKEAILPIYITRVHDMKGNELWRTDTRIAYIITRVYGMKGSGGNKNRGQTYWWTTQAGETARNKRDDGHTTWEPLSTQGNDQITRIRQWAMYVHPPLWACTLAVRVFWYLLFWFLCIGRFESRKTECKLQCLFPSCICLLHCASNAKIHFFLDIIAPTDT